MKNIRRMMLELCLVIGLVCGNARIVQAEEEVPTKVIDGYVCEWQDGMNTTSIQKYQESATNLEIPAELGGRKVTSIKDKAFRGRTTLETVVIPEGITEIGDSAFEGCTSLQTVTLPSTMMHIGNRAFNVCNSLEMIAIPEGITEIGDSAFRMCESLHTVALPSTVTSIANQAFYYCRKLTNISLPDNIRKVGSNAFEGCESLQMLSGFDHVVDVGTGVFTECGGLISIAFSKDLTNISESMFEYCSSLKSVDLPEHLTSIGAYAFRDCNSLNNITIPKGVTDIGKNAFAGCSSMESVVMPSKVTYIGDSVFRECKNLHSIDMPDSLGSISQCMFTGCEKLENIVIPDDVMVIDKYAFGGCSSLTDIEIPEGVTSIGDGAFGECHNLTNIELPMSLKSIGNLAFGFQCKNVPLIYAIPGSYADWWLTQDQSDCEAVWSVGYILEDDNCRVKVLSEENDLTVEYRNPIRSDAVEYTIPDTVTINKVSYRVTSIADNAFTECSNVEKVTLGRNVGQIAPDAFAGIDGKDDKLELVIPEEVEDISNMGITNISNVNNITINVAAGSQAEIYLQQFNTIHYYTYPPTQKPDPGQNNSQGTTDGKQDTTENVPSKPNDITVSNPTVDTQPVSAPVIGQIYTVGQANYLILSSDQVSFSGSANKKIKTLKIPDTVTINGHLYRVARIEKKAMTGCAKLQTVVIGNQVTEIGENAFCKCKKLQKVTIGSQVTKIGKGAFSGDKKLKRMILKGPKVTKIGKKALKGVPKRIRITAPKKCVSKYKKLLNAAK